MRSDHRCCSLADNSWWFWVVFRVGSKQKILITFIFRPYTMKWSRAFSLPLNEAALFFEIVSFNCLDQLQITQQEASLLQLKEIGWEIKNGYCCTTYILWWHMCSCPPLYECVYCKLSPLYNSSHLYSIQHICMHQCISCCTFQLACFWRCLWWHVTAIFCLGPHINKCQYCWAGLGTDLMHCWIGELTLDPDTTL